MTTDMANEQAQTIIARIQHWTEFPGMDRLNLDPDDPRDKRIADAIVVAHRAAIAWPKHFEQSADFGRLATMLQYRIITATELEIPITYYAHAYTRKLFNLV